MFILEDLALGLVHQVCCLLQESVLLGWGERRLVLTELFAALNFLIDTLELCTLNLSKHLIDARFGGLLVLHADEVRQIGNFLCFFG